MSNNKQVYLVTYHVDPDGESERGFLASTVEEALDLAWEKVDNEEDYPAFVHLNGEVVWP